MTQEPRTPSLPQLQERQPPPLDAALLLRQLHDQCERERRQQECLPPVVRTVVGSAGAGFAYGTMFGTVVAGVQGMRASPAHVRLRGALHHIKAEVPRTAGRIAFVSCLFRVASLALSAVRDRLDRDSDNVNTSSNSSSEPIAVVHEDMWNVLLAAPLAGAVLKLRHGPRAALHNAFAFGSVTAVMVVFHAAERQVHGHNSSSGSGSDSRIEAREVLEEVAFAQEFDDFEA